MPFIQSSISVAANATVENLIAGSQFEFAPYNASVDVALTGSAIGLVADVSTGQDVVAENMSVPGVNRFGLIPDDYAVQDVVRSGERIKLRVRNTTAAAVTCFFSVRMMPIMGGA